MIASSPAGVWRAERSRRTGWPAGMLTVPASSSSWRSTDGSSQPPTAACAPAPARHSLKLATFCRVMKSDAIWGHSFPRQPPDVNGSTVDPSTNHIESCRSFLKLSGGRRLQEWSAQKVRSPVRGVRPGRRLTSGCLCACVAGRALCAHTRSLRLGRHSAAPRGARAARRGARLLRLQVTLASPPRWCHACGMRARAFAASNFAQRSGVKP